MNRIHTVAAGRFTPKLDWTDSELADAITEHAAFTLELGGELVTESYFSAAHSHPSHSGESLDAALAVAFLCSRTKGASLNEAIRSLELRYPHLEMQIAEAAELEFMTAEVLPDKPIQPRVPVILLPASCGPAITPDGPSRYELIEFLGSGAYGAVYRGIDRLLSTPEGLIEVAVKIVAHRKDSGTAIAEEAILARRVAHPGVVKVYDAGNSNEHNADYIVYELVEGSTLSIAANRFSNATLREKVLLLLDVSNAIHAIHASGFIHNDIKPQNILVDSTGVIRVTDLGIASRLGESRFLQSGIGALGFLAPEILLGTQEPSQASDVYSLGALASWLIRGKCLAGDSARSVYDFHERCFSGINDRYPTHGDSELDRFIRKATAHRPSFRHQSADALATDLLAWLERKPMPSFSYSHHKRTIMNAKRKPLLVTLTLGIAAAVSAGSYGWHLREVDRVALDRTQRLGNELVDIHSQTLLRMTESGGSIAERMTMVFALDSLQGTGLVSDVVLKRTKCDNLIAIASDLHERSTPGSIERALWGYVAGLWMLEHDEITPEAEKLLRETHADFLAMGEPGHDWASRTDLLADCAYVKQRWFERPSRPAENPEDLQRLREIADKLQSAFEDQQTKNKYGPIYEQLSRQLQHVHGIRLLKNREIFIKYQQINSYN